MTIGRYDEDKEQIIYDHRSYFIQERNFYLNVSIYINKDEVTASCFIGYLNEELKSHCNETGDIEVISGSLAEVMAFIEVADINYSVNWLWNKRSDKYNLMCKYSGGRKEAARIFELR
jgi:hypothetical protein